MLFLFFFYGQEDKIGKAEGNQRIGFGVLTIYAVID